MPGVRAEAQKALNAALASWSQKGLFTHAFVAAGDLAAPKPLITESFLPDGRDLFDLASMTKALVTTPAVFNLSMDGKWLMERPLGEAPLIVSVPQRFAHIPRELFSLTPRMLLRHEAGLPAWRNFYVECHHNNAPAARRGFFEVLAAAARHPKLTKPAYSDVGFLALGAFLEASYQADIASIFNGLCSDARWFSTAFPQPSLALGFAPDFDSAERDRRAIPTGPCPVRQRNLIGEVYDENAWALGGRCAHAGLFSSGAELITFLTGLAQSPRGQALVAAQAAEIAGNENESLLGWRQGGDPVARAFGGGKSMGHLGFTGTAFWITPADHPEKPLRYAIILTNRTISGRINPAIKDFRRQVLELLWSAV